MSAPGPVSNTQHDDATARPHAGDAAFAASLPELLLARIPRVSRDGICVARNGRIEWSNPALAALLGREGVSLVGIRLADIVVEQLDAAGAVHRTAVDLATLCADGRSPMTVNLARPGAASVAVAVDAVRLDPIADDYWVVTFRSISRQVRADEELRASEAQFRALAANAPIGVFQSDHGVRLAYLNPRFAELWGDEPERLQGTGWLDAIHDDDRPNVIASLSRTLAGEEVTNTFRVERSTADTRLVHARVVPVTRGDRSIGFVGSIEDVTAARRHEEELAWQATHDPLTGLANRTELLNQVHRAIADRAEVAVLFFDLDDFKVVNDSLGHGAGDLLLRTVGDRIAANLRDGDMVARFGGDEFVVLCRDAGGEAGAAEVARRLLEALDRPVKLGVRTVRVTASVGIVLGRPGEADADALLRDADVAMYQAKHAGKARLAVFDERARHRMEQHLEIMNGVRQAMAGGGIGVGYQPLVLIADRRIVGAEALLRYEHPTQGPIPALEVIRLAESSGSITELGAAVLGTACRDLRAWQLARGDAAPGYVAVNVAAAQLVEEAGLVATVRECLDAHGLEPHHLCLELTESQLMSDADQASRVLGELRRLGVRIAVDDFGTGYSSLAYLRRFPVDVVKLDRSFIADVASDQATAAVVRAVVALAAALDIAVAAEGVETPEQLSTVESLGCDLVQGYAVGRPTSPATFPLEATWP